MTYLEVRLYFQLEPKVFYIREMCDVINWFQNSQSVRITFSNLKWHIDEMFTFSALASLWAVRGQSVKITDIVYFGPEFMFLNSPFITQLYWGSFVKVTWPSTEGCMTFWPTAAMCPYSPVSPPAHLILGENKG